MTASKCRCCAWVGRRYSSRVHWPVHAIAASVLLRVGAGAPQGGEFAYMAVEPGGNLVVSDSKRHTVLRFDPTGHLLSEWGPRLGDTLLGEPAGVAVQGDNFYVLDRGSAPRIFQLDATGRLQTILNLESFGTYGLNGLAVDRGGNLYAADTGRNRILVLAPNGSLVRQIGHSGADLGGLTQPMMLAFAADGSFVVADWENTRLERWDANFEATDVWTTASHPFGVAIDQIGRIFVPDTDHRRVQAYSAQGALLGEMGAAGSPAIDVAPKQVAIARACSAFLFWVGRRRRGTTGPREHPAATAGRIRRGRGQSGRDLPLVGIPGFGIVSRRSRRDPANPTGSAVRGQGSVTDR